MRLIDLLLGNRESGMETELVGSFSTDEFSINNQSEFEPAPGDSLLLECMPQLSAFYSTNGCLHADAYVTENGVVPPNHTTGLENEEPSASLTDLLKSESVISAAVRRNSQAAINDPLCDSVEAALKRTGPNLSLLNVGNTLNLSSTPSNANSKSANPILVNMLQLENGGGVATPDIKREPECTQHSLMNGCDSMMDVSSLALLDMDEGSQTFDEGIAATDVGSLLEQFEEAAASLNDVFMGNEISTPTSNVISLETPEYPDPSPSPQPDILTPQIIASLQVQQSPARPKSTVDPDSEVVKLLKQKHPTQQVAKLVPPESNSGKSPPKEVIQKIKSSRKRKSAILLDDVPNKHSGGKPGAAIGGSRKLQRILGQSDSGSDTDRSSGSQKAHKNQIVIGNISNACVPSGGMPAVVPVSKEKLQGMAAIKFHDTNNNGNSSALGMQTSCSNNSILSTSSSESNLSQNSDQCLQNNIEAPKFDPQSSESNGESKSSSSGPDSGPQIHELHRVHKKKKISIDAYKERVRLRNGGSLPSTPGSSLPSTPENSRPTTPVPMAVAPVTVQPVCKNVSLGYYKAIVDHDYCQNVPRPKVADEASGGDQGLDHEPHQPVPAASSPSEGASKEVKAMSPSVLKSLLLNKNLADEMRREAEKDRVESMRNMMSMGPRRRLDTDREVVDMDLDTSHDDLDQIQTPDQIITLVNIPPPALPEVDQGPVRMNKPRPSWHEHRRYRRRNRERSPELRRVSTEPYIDKIPSRYTALSLPNKPGKIIKSSSQASLVDTSLPTRDRDPSPDLNDPTYSKVPDYVSNFTNSTLYDDRSVCSLTIDSHPASVASSRHASPAPRSSVPSRSHSPSRHSRSRSRSRTSCRSRSESGSSSCSGSRSRSRSVSVSSSCSSRAHSQSPSRNWLPEQRGRPTHRKSRRKSSYSSRSSSSCSCSRSCSRSRYRSTSRLRSRSSSRSKSPYQHNHGRPHRSYRHRTRSRSRSWERLYNLKQSKLREQEKVQQMEERRIMYVGGIAEGCTREYLQRKFEVFGEVEKVQVHFREHGDNYAFVTFHYTCDTYAAIEKGNKLPHCEKFDLCFGGRRHFCKVDYADLDGNMEEEEEMATVIPKQQSLDFDDLLRQALAKKKKPNRSNTRH